MLAMGLFCKYGYSLHLIAYYKNLWFYTRLLKDDEMGKYKPATFQPTIRPDWGGILSYIPEKEKADILEAIIKYPSIECDSIFWLETIKPDLDMQYEEFTKQCAAKSRGIRNRWAKTSITTLKDNNNTSNRYDIVSERIEEREEERKGIEKNNQVDFQDEKKEYAVNYSIIKLNEKDFNSWKEAYPYLNIRAECMMRNKWLEQQSEEDQKKWFISTARYFVKQNEIRKKQQEETNFKKEFDDGHRFMTDEECDNFWRD